jgi:hypothetical protein
MGLPACVVVAGRSPVAKATRHQRCAAAAIYRQLQVLVLMLVLVL